MVLAIVLRLVYATIKIKLNLIAFITDNNAISISYLVSSITFPLCLAQLTILNLAKPTSFLVN